MKRKILTILVSMLFLTMIPSVVGETVKTDLEDRSTDIDVARTFYRGLVIFPRRYHCPPILKFYAISVSYMTIAPEETIQGRIWFKWVIVPTGELDSVFGVFWYVFGFIHGRITILD